MRWIFITAAVLALVAIPVTASAHGGHTGCQGYGQHVAETVRSVDGGLAPFVKQLVPLNDEVTVEHALFCD